MRQDRLSPEDDGHVIADMSGIERQPLLIPRFDRPVGQRRDLSGQSGQSSSDFWSMAPQTPDLDAGEKRALILGALSAGILVAGAIALAFAVLILLILFVF